MKMYQPAITTPATLETHLRTLENTPATSPISNCLAWIESDMTMLQSNYDLSSFVERLVRVGEVHKSGFNDYIKRHPHGSLFKFLLPYPHLFDIHVKIMVVLRFDSNATDLERCQLLEECMSYLHTTVKLSEISGTVISLILSIKNTSSVLRIAERNQNVFNNLLDLASTVGSAKKLYLIFANSLHLLNHEVKCKYYRLKHFSWDPDTLMELLNDCLAKFETSRDFNGTVECLKTIVALFKETTIDTRLAESKFLHIAAAQKEYINRFLLDTHTPEVYSLLKSCPDLMDIQVTAKYIDAFDDYSDMWENLLVEMITLSTASDFQTKQECITSIEVISDALETQNAERLKSFAKEHKEIINNIHRQNVENLTMGGVLSNYPTILDKDILIKYLSKTYVIPNKTEENLIYMLMICVDELKTANEELQIVALLPAIDRLLSLYIFVNNRLTPITDELAEYAKNNKLPLNKSLRMYMFRQTGLLKILAKFDDLFDTDIKIKYNEVLLPQMSRESKFNFLLGCLESIKSERDAVTIGNIVSKTIQLLYIFTYGDNKNFSETHKDLINKILYQYVPSVKNNPIFRLIKNYEELWSMEIKIKFAQELLEHYEEDTKWEIIEKLLEKPVHHIGSCLRLMVDNMFHKKSSNVSNMEKLKHFIENHGKIIREVIDTKDICPSILPLIMQYSTSMNFEGKLEYLRDKVKHTTYNSVRLNIDRSNIVTSSFTVTSMFTDADWKNKFLICFINEDGVDCGGISREWFTILTREMFNPNYVLFTTAPGDPNSYMINKASHVNPEHLEYFKFFGRIIAKSIIENQRVHCNFTKAFYKQILNIPVDCSDLESQDPIFFKSMHFLWKHPTEQLNMDLTFSTEVQEFGETTIKDLVENGRDIPVTDENKEEYVKLICQMKMTESIKEQLTAFQEGFNSIIPLDIISVFTPDELEILIAGQPNIDVNNLEANTEYKDYEPTDEHILWFWRALKSFNVVERSKFLMFTTGSPNAPLHGFGALLGSSGVQKFTISKDDRDGNRLPTASTCMNRLSLPQYDSYSSMRAAILTAIEEGTEGFYVP